MRPTKGRAILLAASAATVAMLLAPAPVGPGSDRATPISANNVVSSTAGPTAASTAPAAIGPTRFPGRTLSYGMTDPSIQTLQQLLRMPVATGYFGPMTLMYVKTLQQTARVAVTGDVDKKTWRKASQAYRRASRSAIQSNGSTSPILGTHPTLGSVAAPMTRFRDGGHAYYKFNGRLHSCRYTGKCLDLNAPIGAPVYALADGVLQTPPYAARSYGNYVTIKHRDGTESIYAHLAGVTVQAGPVRAGTQIGTNGCSGTSGEPNGCKSTYGAHLHLEWSGLHWKRGEPGELPPYFNQWRGNPPRCYQGC